MKRSYFIFAILLLFPCALIAHPIPKNIVELIKQSTACNDGIHIVKIDNKPFEVVIDNKEISSIKRRVFQDDLRKNMDSVIVDFLEEAYAAYLLSIDNPKFDDVKITKGSWATLEKLEGNVRESNLVYNDFRHITVSLKSETDEICINFPVDYQKFHHGDRGEIEKKFIAELMSYKITACRKLPHYSRNELVDIGNNNLLLKGSTYLIPAVNRNSYLSKDDSDSLCFITNPKQPIATFSNMIVIGVGYDATLKLSISTHEYGSKKNIAIPLEQFLQYCIHKGCDIYWGYEKTESSILYGTIFCYNQKQGYDHIIHLHCNLENLGKEDFEIESRGSLFVPTTNIQNIFQTYESK